MNAVKVCNICITPKPRSSDYFYKRSSSSDGLENRCKACHLEQRSKNRKKQLQVDWSTRLLLNAQRSHRDRQGRGRVSEFGITKQHIASLLEDQKGKCYWSGIRLNLADTKSLYYPSLDRKDSQQGYVPGNVVLTTWVINRMKGDLPEPEFLRVLYTISAAVLHEAAIVPSIKA